MAPWGAGPMSWEMDQGGLASSRPLLAPALPPHLQRHQLLVFSGSCTPAHWDPTDRCHLNDGHSWATRAVPDGQCHHTFSKGRHTLTSVTVSCGMVAKLGEEKVKPLSVPASCG